MTTIELARFTVSPEAEETLVEGRPAMIAALRTRFPGCLAAYLTKEEGGDWLDVIVWRDRAEALDAARTAPSIPECAAWFQHIATSGGLRHVEVVHSWPGTDT